MSKIDWNPLKNKNTVLEAAIVGISWGLLIVVPAVLLAWIGRDWTI